VLHARPRSIHHAAVPGHQVKRVNLVNLKVNARQRPAKRRCLTNCLLLRMLLELQLNASVVNALTEEDGASNTQR
jgi:hypothetical protein